MESSSKTKTYVLLTAHFDSQHWVIIIDPSVFTWNPLFLIHALSFPKMQSFTVGYSGAHSAGLSLTSLWAHTCQLQMFLKPFPTVIITLYPFLLPELLMALNPSLPPYRLLSCRTFLVKLDLWFHSHQKKPLQKDSHEAAMQGTRKYFCFWKHMENGP